jgi:hypothetical protein
MNRTLALLVIALLIAPSSALAQLRPVEQSAPDRSIGWPVFVEVQGGYTTFSMQEASDAFRTALGAYRDIGVVLPMQQDYPGNGLLGLDVLVGPLPWLHVGLGGRMTRTQAASIYGDYAGTLDVVARADLWTVEGIARFERPLTQRIRPFGGVRGGLALGRYTLSEDVAIDLSALAPDLPPEQTVGSSQATLRASGAGFTSEGFAGLRYVMGRVALSTQAGYRFARVVNPDGRGTTDAGDVLFDGELPFTLGYAGWVGTLGLSVNVGRR